MTEWLSSFEALSRLRAAAFTDPIDTLTHLAEAGILRSRAASGRFSDYDDEIHRFPDEPPCNETELQVKGPWPDVPADFWRWVNLGGNGAEVHGEAGVFGALVIFDPKIGDYSDREHIKLFGVTFNASDLSNFLNGHGAVHSTPRMPRSKAGPKMHTDRWAEFGAALAFIAYQAGPEVLKSQDALYDAAANALTMAGRPPLSKKSVRRMLQYAQAWIDNEEILQATIEE